MRNGGTPSQEWILSACKFHTFVYHVTMPAVVQYLSAGATSIRIWMVCTPFSHPLTWIVPRGLSNEMVFWVHWLSLCFFIPLPCLRKHKLHRVHWHIHVATFTISHTYLHWMIYWKPSGPPTDDDLHTWTPSLQTMSWCDLIPTLLSNISFVHGKEYAYLTNKSPIFSPLSVLYIT